MSEEEKQPSPEESTNEQQQDDSTKESSNLVCATEEKKQDDSTKESSNLDCSTVEKKQDDSTKESSNLDYSAEEKKQDDSTKEPSNLDCSTEEKKQDDSTTGPKFECSKCKWSFLTNEGLQHHIKNVCGQQKEKLPSIINKPSKVIKKKSKKTKKTAAGRTTNQGEQNSRDLELLLAEVEKNGKSTKKWDVPIKIADAMSLLQTKLDPIPPLSKPVPPYFAEGNNMNLLKNVKLFFREIPSTITDWSYTNHHAIREAFPVQRGYGSRIIPHSLLLDAQSDTDKLIIINWWRFLSMNDQKDQLERMRDTYCNPTRSNDLLPLDYYEKISAGGREDRKKRKQDEIAALMAGPDYRARKKSNTDEEKPEYDKRLLYCRGWRGEKMEMLFRKSYCDYFLNHGTSINATTKRFMINEPPRSFPILSSISNRSGLKDLHFVRVSLKDPNNLNSEIPPPPPLPESASAGASASNDKADNNSEKAKATAGKEVEAITHKIGGNASIQTEIKNSGYVAHSSNVLGEAVFDSYVLRAKLCTTKRMPRKPTANGGNSQLCEHCTKFCNVVADIIRDEVSDKQKQKVVDQSNKQKERIKTLESNLTSIKRREERLRNKLSKMQHKQKLQQQMQHHQREGVDEVNEDHHGHHENIAAAVPMNINTTNTNNRQRHDNNMYRNQPYHHQGHHAYHY